MDLKALLVDVPPREDSGARTSDRYDFQKNWALCEILARHDAEGDYCVILEHHEDVIVLDSAEDPSTVELYQVKSRDGTHWTLSQLLARKKGEAGPKPSFLGRLVLNKIIFGDYAKGVHFISNLPYRVALQSGSDSSTMEVIRLSDLTADQLKKVVAKMKMEHAPRSLVPFEACTTLERCKLPLIQHDDHTVGLIGRFLQKRTPGAAYSITTIHSVLFDEVRRKTNYQGECKTLGDYIEHRSVSRRQFEEIVRHITRPRDLDGLWALAERRLEQEGVSMRALLRMRAERSRYETEVMSSVNGALAAMRKAVQKAIAALQDDDLALTAVLNHVRAAIAPGHASLMDTMGKAYVDACIVLEFIATSAGPEFQAPDSEPSEEAA